MDILKEIKPDKKEEIRLKERINNFIKKIKIKDTKVILGGSGAKGTWLRNQVDADIFVKFDYRKYKDKDISKILGKSIKKKFPKVELMHGSRDYFNIAYDNFIFEIIPVLDIKKASEAKNITDISPLHALWVRKNSNEKMRDEIRKFKYFLKINDLYGAESYIRGFSGYVAEILIIYYKSLDNLIKNIRRWKAGQVIDIEHHGTAFSLNESKKSPLIIIDPVQNDRNAAAALSKEKFDRLISLSKKKISFNKKKLDFKKYNLILEVIPKKNKKDVMGAKSLKIFEYIKKNLEKFYVKDALFKFDNKVLMYFKLKKTILDKYSEHQGPPIAIEDGCRKFLRKYGKQKTYVKNNRYYVKLLNRNRKVKAHINNLLKEKYVKEKMSKCSITII